MSFVETYQIYNKGKIYVANSCECLDGVRIMKKKKFIGKKIERKTVNEIKTSSAQI